MAYIDPGSFGLISQIGYALLVAVVTGFMFPVNALRKMLKRLFNRSPVRNASDKSSE